MKHLIKFIATGVYTGFFPIVPGTIGTIPAWVIAWFFLEDPYMLAAAAVVTTIISVWAAGAAESVLGHDSKKIVIDEWAGMFISLLFLPYRLDVFVAAFVFFRFYDVIKPYPAGRSESLPNGWGVTADDVFAGIYANLTCRLGIFLLEKMGWFGF